MITLRRQLDELALIKAMYPEEFILLKPHVTLEELINFPDSLLENINMNLMFAIISTFPNGDSVQLKFSLPESYPLVYPEIKVIPPILGLEFGNIPVGTECLDMIIAAILSSWKPPSDTMKVSSNRYSRVIFWFHHLLSTQKRKDIVSFADELGIKGYSKPGYPGLLYVEGEQTNMEEYTTRIKSMKWQACQVRLSRSIDAMGVASRLKECETIGEIVESIWEKEEFLEACGVRRPKVS